jgi:hypothetical protein
MPATDHVPPTTGNGEAEAIELVGVGDDGEAVSR